MFASRRSGIDFGALANIIVIGACLRAAIVAFGPVALRVGEDLEISGAGLGLLASLPIIMFGLVSAFVARPAQAIGFDRLSLVALLTLAVGIATRLIPDAWAMWVGTAGVGLGIGVLNVLAPALVKRDFPKRMSMVTGLYTATVTSAAAASVGLSMPLTQAFDGDWRIALAASLPVVILAITLQSIRVLRAKRNLSETSTILIDGRDKNPTQQTPHPQTPLWKSPLAWAVTAFMGLQSLTFYTFISWMPSISVEAGFTEAEAGFHLALNQILGIPAALVIAALLQRFRDQRAVALVLALLGMVPFIGTIYFPELIPFWTPFFGVVTSGYFSMALALIGERAGSSRDAARLSGMAQSIGYLLAGAGPIAAGWLHDATGSWQPVLWMFILVAALLGLAGLVAGQNKRI